MFSKKAKKDGRKLDLSWLKQERQKMKNLIKPILFAGLVVGILDGIDAIIAYKLVLGFDPVPIYQFVASGLLGQSAYLMGATSFLIGVAVHFLVAFTASAFYFAAATKLAWLNQNAFLSGIVYGIGVWTFMNFVVTPLSQIPASPFNLALFINGVVGHALFVGLPISLIARRVRARLRWR